MVLTSVRATVVISEGAGSVEGFAKVVMEFFISEISCLVTALDQVFTRFGLGVESVEECAQTSADSVTNDRIADLSADRVGHSDGRVRGLRNETDSK
jgi:hypothetical protein